MPLVLLPIQVALVTVATGVVLASVRRGWVKGLFNVSSFLVAASLASLVAGSGQVDSFETDSLIWLRLMAAGLTFGLTVSAQRDDKALIATAESVEPQATDITSTSMELWGTDIQTQGVFTGNVVVIGTNMRKNASDGIV